MERTHNLNLASANVSDFVRKKTLFLPKGKAMLGIRCKFTVPIQNTNAAGQTLTGAGDKKLLLQAFSAILTYGATDRRKPINNIDFFRIRALMRYLFSTEIEGYNDTTTGMGQTFPASSTTNCVFYVVIPTCRIWMLRELMNYIAIGRSQAQTVQLEIRRNANPSFANTNLLINGTCTVDVFPMLVTSKYDRWSYVPEYSEQTIQDFKILLPDGLPLWLIERTAAHASTAITDVTLNIDDERVHRNVKPSDYITEYKDTPFFEMTGLADDTDTDTFLYYLTWDSNIEEVKTGKLYFENVKKDLSSYAYGVLMSPLVSESELQADLQFVANTIRMKSLKAVSMFSLLPVPRCPPRLQPYLGFAMLDEQDGEYQRFPGWVTAPGAVQPTLVFPEQTTGQVKGLVATAQAAKKPLAVEKHVRDFALAIPGSVQSGRGIGSNPGSSYLNARAALGA